MTRLTNPTPLFLDGRGVLLDGGYIYIGIAAGDPEVQPIDTFWDAGLTVPAAQPFRTMGGVIVNGASPSQVFFAETDYALTIRDGDSNLVFYSATSYPLGTAYQPLDADLTAIAALATTPYGRGLLTLANQAALMTATGIPSCLPLAGGEVTGDITRSGAGGFGYWSNDAMNSGRKFLTASDAADPTSQPGDEWNKYVA